MSIGKIFIKNNEDLVNAAVDRMCILLKASKEKDIKCQYFGWVLTPVQIELLFKKGKL